EPTKRPKSTEKGEKRPKKIERREAWKRFPSFIQELASGGLLKLVCARRRSRRSMSRELFPRVRTAPASVSFAGACARSAQSPDPDTSLRTLRPAPPRPPR